MKPLCLAFSLCLASMASAQESITLLPAPIELPTRIGPLRFDGRPHAYEPAALGVSYQYNGAGISLTVYVYDAGVRNIPDGADTPVNCLLFEQAKREVAAAASDIRLVSQQLVRLAAPDDAPSAREAVFELVRDGESMLSYVWMTGVAKHIVKVRFSLASSYLHEAESARGVLLAALGDAVKPHLADASDAAEASEATLNMISGASREEMAAGLTYLAMLQVLADQAPESRPVCGGDYIPTYAIELAAFQAMLALDLQEGTGRFGRQLVAAGKAGFLDELVWVEMHRDAWGGDAPDGLALTEYTAWKKRNLRRFKRPRLGSLFFNQPRPMEWEAAPEAP